MTRHVKSEKQLYYLITTVLGISILGIPYIKYLVYALPVIVLFSAILLRCITINIDRANIPFILILLISLPTAYNYDINSIKKVIFIAAYTTIFVFVDFSKVKINLYYYGTILGIIFILQVATGIIHDQSGALNYSIMDSKSPFESSLSFPFAILASFYVLQSRWLLSLVYLFLVFLALKRIAIISVVITFIAKLVPGKLRVILLNPYLIIAISLFITFTSIYFAYGEFDQEITNFFDKSPNDLSKGRQSLWLSALNSLNYEFSDFILYGSGVGTVVTALSNVYGVDRILIHNDILALYLEFGLILLVVFLVLHLHQKTFEQQVLALGLTVLLFTDNVIIYQHVMLTYLFAQSQYTRKNRLKRNAALQIQPKTLNSSRLIPSKSNPDISTGNEKIVPRSPFGC